MDFERILTCKYPTLPVPDIESWLLRANLDRSVEVSPKSEPFRNIGHGISDKSRSTGFPRIGEDAMQIPLCQGLTLALTRDRPFGMQMQMQIRFAAPLLNFGGVISTIRFAYFFIKCGWRFSSNKRDPNSMILPKGSDPF